VSATANTPDTFGPSLGGSRGERALRALKGSAPIFLVLIALIAWITAIQPSFLEPGPFLAFLKRAAPLAILAAGQYYVIVSGGFDLSVGSLVTVEVVVAARLLDGDDGSNVPVIALLIGLGLLVGLVNGTITTRLRVPSFITTLGMLLILQGAVFLWTNGSPQGALSDGFRTIGRGGIDGVPVLDQLPWSVLILLVIGAVSVLAMRADFGRKLLAVGDNDRAAHLAGVPVARMRTIAFVLSGLSAAIAGILLGGFAGVSAQVGLGMEFEAITAVVLGGVAIGGGKGSIVAAMAGALTLEALFTLLNLQGVSGALDSSVQGLIIIGAVAFASRRLQGAR
jgi:ribose transport system permease protein